MINELTAERLIGSRAARGYLPLLDRVSGRVASVRYSFMDTELFRQLAQSDPRKGMQIYWSEILFRSHLAAAVSILRNIRWLAGAALAFENANFLAFAASLRSFIEAAGDTNNSLGQVPLSLAENGATIKSALAGTLEQAVVSAELEDKLIHFSHARRVSRNEGAPDSHKKKPSSEYVAEFNWFNAPEVADLYAELCEYVHPAASSVALFVGASPDSSDSQISTELEKQILRQVVERLPEQIEPAAMLAFNIPLVTLGVLNRLPLASLHTPEVTAAICRGIPLWTKVERALDRVEQAPPNSYEASSRQEVKRPPRRGRRRR